MHLQFHNRFILATFVSLIVLTFTHFATLLATASDKGDVVIKKDVKEDVETMEAALKALGNAILLVPKNFKGELGARIPISVIAQRLDVLMQTTNKKKDLPSFNSAKSDEETITWNSDEWKHIQEELRKEAISAFQFIQSYLATQKKSAQEVAAIVDEQLKTLQSHGEKATMAAVKQAAETVHNALSDFQPKPSTLKKMPSKKRS